MINVEKVVQTIKDIIDRYGLKLLDLDHTDITLIARIGFSRRSGRQTLISDYNAEYS